MRRGVGLAASIALELVLTNTGLAAGAAAPQREARALDRAVDAAANRTGLKQWSNFGWPSRRSPSPASCG
jgi:hypothetical protein